MIEWLVRKSLRLTVSTFQSARRMIWYFTRPVALGVHAVALTSSGRLVLVRLTYAPGWRLPGGGRKTHEEPREALLRELREEIGLTSHGAVEHAFDYEHRPDFRRGHAAVFIVREVHYQAPRWSFEIESVQDFRPDRLPADMHHLAREQVERALSSPDRSS